MLLWFHFQQWIQGFDYKGYQVFSRSRTIISQCHISDVLLSHQGKNEIPFYDKKDIWKKLQSAKRMRQNIGNWRHPDQCLWLSFDTKRPHQQESKATIFQCRVKCCYRPATILPQSAENGLNKANFIGGPWFESCQQAVVSFLSKQILNYWNVNCNTLHMKGHQSLTLLWIKRKHKYILSIILQSYSG